MEIKTHADTARVLELIDATQFTVTVNLWATVGPDSKPQWQLCINRAGETGWIIGLGPTIPAAFSNALSKASRDFLAGKPQAASVAQARATPTRRAPPAGPAQNGAAKITTYRSDADFSENDPPKKSKEKEIDWGDWEE